MTLNYNWDIQKLLLSEGNGLKPQKRFGMSRNLKKEIAWMLNLITNVASQAFEIRHRSGAV
jgi:hypothetical protein